MRTLLQVSARVFQRGWREGKDRQGGINPWSEDATKGAEERVLISLRFQLGCKTSAPATMNSDMFSPPEQNVHPKYEPKIGPSSPKLLVFYLVTEVRKVPDTLSRAEGFRK